MTSIEALNKILSYPISLGYDTDYDPPQWCGDFPVGMLFEEEEKMLLEDLEILEILRKHLYVAPELVELKMTGQEYANIHKVKYHNGIPIVVDLETFNKINKWFNKRGGRK